MKVSLKTCTLLMHPHTIRCLLAANVLVVLVEFLIETVKMTGCLLGFRGYSGPSLLPEYTHSPESRSIAVHFSAGFPTMLLDFSSSGSLSARSMH